jgi:hypothetical protein
MTKTKTAEEINLKNIDDLLEEFYTKNKEGKGSGYPRRLILQFSDVKNSELQQQLADKEKELNRKHAMWENQQQTIRNYHAVFIKHFGYDELACSEYLDKNIAALKEENDSAEALGKKILGEDGIVYVNLLKKDLAAKDLLLKEAMEALQYYANQTDNSYCAKTALTKLNTKGI